MVVGELTLVGEDRGLRRNSLWLLWSSCGGNEVESKHI